MRYDVAPGATASSPRAAARPSLVALHSKTGRALIAATALASTVGFLNATAVNVVVPAIGRDLGMGMAALHWALTGYLVSAAALLLLSGALADRFGRRGVLKAGLLVILAASIACATAPSIGVLIGARLAQGAGAALVIPSGLALLYGTLCDRDRARGIGAWAGLATLGGTVGPYVAGWLVEHASWRWLFALNLPLILAALFALRGVPEADAAHRPLRLDVRGAMLAVIGIGGVSYALIDGAASGWINPGVIAAASLGTVSLMALLPVERHAPAPMLPLSLFASRQFSAVNVTTILFYGALSAASYLLVLQLQLQLGYSASQAGAALIPQAAAFVVVSPLSGGLVVRIGPRWPTATGILIVSAAFLWLSSAHVGTSYTTGILPSVVLLGLGLGLAVGPLTAATLADISDTDLGEASAVNSAASQLGGVMAIALVPALIGGGAISLADALTDGFQPAMIVLAAVCAASAVISALFVAAERAQAPRVLPPLAHPGCAIPVAGAAA